MSEQRHVATNDPMSDFKTWLNPDEPYYEFVIDDQGPVVYSECCADRMTPEVALKVRDALTEWLDQQEDA